MSLCCEENDISHFIRVPVRPEDKTTALIPLEACRAAWWHLEGLTNGSCWDAEEPEHQVESGEALSHTLHGNDAVA